MNWNLRGVSARSIENPVGTLFWHSLAASANGGYLSGAKKAALHGLTNEPMHAP